MAKATFIELPLIKYQDQLANISDKSEEIASSALYEGARIYAQSITQELNAVLSPASQGGELVQALGIAPFKVDADFNVNTHIGFDGYQAVNGKRIPFQLLGRALNSGTIVRGVQHILPRGYIKKGAQKAKAAAESAMQRAAEQKIEQLKGGV